MQIPRQAFGVCAINNYIYCLGGINKGQVYNSMERFDTIKNKWTVIQEA